MDTTQRRHCAVWTPWLLGWLERLAPALLNGFLRALAVEPRRGDTTARAAATVTAPPLLAVHVGSPHGRLPIQSMEPAFPVLPVRWLSMPLGADIDEVSTAYENTGRRALDAGVLIVAAAGNNAERSVRDTGFVGVPANSPSIMAVGAVDLGLAIADFSAAASSAEGGQVDIAGPGVDVYSAWPLPQGTNTISGTSMATPHVSGIAALWAQRTGARGRELWTGLTRSAQRLPLSPDDAGAGLVRAPGA